MCKRFVAVWFPHLLTDWWTILEPSLKGKLIAVTIPSHGRTMIHGASPQALSAGIHPGMTLADARALEPGLADKPFMEGIPEKILFKLAQWCIRFSPSVAVDPPDGLLIDATGCGHLWGGESHYLDDIFRKLTARGYMVHAAMADTIGAAWAMSRFHNGVSMSGPGKQFEELPGLPPELLRLEPGTTAKLHKLGLKTIRDLTRIPRRSLERRFGPHLLMRINQAMGTLEETIVPVIPVEPFEERLPCLELILTRTGVEIALKKLLDAVSVRLQQEQKGLRKAVFSGFLLDGNISSITISTNRPSRKASHLQKLFADKLDDFSVEPGIELFSLSAPLVEDLSPHQEKIWEAAGCIQDQRVAEFMDRIVHHEAIEGIRRFIPAEHHLPERSLTLASSLDHVVPAQWKTEPSRPITMLWPPEPVEVSAPIPDYPPMGFRYKGNYHKIVKADGPERIEQEWWIRRGRLRDYYHVEDDQGKRYWLFRSGQYDEEGSFAWFIHGFFA